LRPTKRTSTCRAQVEHPDSVLTSATIKRRRMAAIEFGIWRSGREVDYRFDHLVGDGEQRRRAAALMAQFAGSCEAIRQALDGLHR
jgi:hypothetical protein